METNWGAWPVSDSDVGTAAPRAPPVFAASQQVSAQLRNLTLTHESARPKRQLRPRRDGHRTRAWILALATSSNATSQARSWLALSSRPTKTFRR